VNPDYKRKCVFVENDKSRQYEVYFESKSEMDKWLDSVIVSKKYGMSEDALGPEPQKGDVLGTITYPDGTTKDIKMK